MDSSGIGVIAGRYKVVSCYGGKVMVVYKNTGSYTKTYFSGGMGMRRKWMSMFLCAAMTAGLLTGCGGEKAPAQDKTAEETKTEAGAEVKTEAGEETASGEKTVVEFWNVFTGSDGDILRGIVDNYNKTNTDNIEIKMDIMPNDQLQQKLPAENVSFPILILLLPYIGRIYFILTK